MTSRRDFLTTGGVALGALAVGPRILGAVPAPPPLPALYTDAATRELMMEALDASKRAGASWADVRISRNRNNSVQTREKQVTDVVETDTMGCGVRVLVDGCWGFAATQELTKSGVGLAAQEAVAIAKANRLARDRRVELAPAPAQVDKTWRSAYTIDPFTIAIEEKADLLLRANAAALTVPTVRFVNSGLSFVKEERNYANTEGTVTTQDYVRSWVTMSCTAVAPDRSGTAVRGPEVVQPAGRGWEYVLEADIVNNAKVWAGEAAEKLTAKPVEPGRYDLILHPSQLFLTIHESVAHATELDRAMGYEANYAGTSFVAPPEKVLGSLKFGSPIMQVVGNRSEPGALGTIGYDDDGVVPDDFPIIKDGILVDYQTNREQAPWLREYYAKTGKPVRSHGCSYAQSWADVAFLRMPNVSLQPGDKDLGWDDLIAATDKGIAMIGRASYSIDQQRYNAQFGAQLCYEIRKGKIVGQVKDAAYQMRTPDFWATLDMLGGKKSYMHGGTFNDGKGQPGQSNAVSHGCPPARFKNANIINTGARAVSHMNNHDAPKSLFHVGRAAAATGVLSREEAQALVERTVKMSKADAVRVSVNSSRETNLRFADNQMSTSGVTTNTTIRVQSVFGKRKASVVTNDRSDEGLRRAVQQSEAIARLAPEDPEYLGELGAQQHAQVNAWSDATAELTAESRARAALSALAPARAGNELTVAGFIICNAAASAIGTNAGLFAYHRGTTANYTLTARTNDGTGSGWVGAEDTDWSKLDFKSVADRAIEKARRSRNPMALEPGRYTVIFEPEATANLVGLMGNAFQARAADEGRSAFAKPGGTKLGEKIVDERVTLYSDPADPLILASPFDGEGLPLSRQTWVQNGVLNQLAYNRFWASKQGKTPTGGTAGLRMADGNDSLESLIASTTRGILVTRLWYLRPLDARTLMYTGLTRDGTFLIENGKISRSIKNFRFNDSPLFMLNNVEGIGKAVRTAGGEGGPGVAMPPIKVRDFNFTSLSDAV